MFLFRGSLLALLGLGVFAAGIGASSDQLK